MCNVTTGRIMTAAVARELHSAINGSPDNCHLEEPNRPHKNEPDRTLPMQAERQTKRQKELLNLAEQQRW